MYLIGGVPVEFMFHFKQLKLDVSGFLITISKIAVLSNFTVYSIYKII